MYTCADLHIHSSNSDWTKSFWEIKNICEKKFNNCVLSITDHNHLTLDRFIETKNNIYIPWIEISAQINWKSIHITWYSLTPHIDISLTNLLNKINLWYKKRAEKIYKKLIKLWYKLPTINNIRNNKLPWPIYTYDFVYHLKKILKINNDNDVLLWCKKNWNILFVKEDNFMPSVKEVVSALHKSNFIACRAHPWSRYLRNIEDEKKFKILYKKIIESNIDWIEVFNKDSSSYQITTLLKYAKSNNLTITWWSDYHWRWDKEKILPLLKMEYIDNFIKKLKII